MARRPSTGTRRGQHRRMIGVDDRWLHAIQCHCVMATARNVDDHRPIPMLHYSVWPIIDWVEWAANPVAADMDVSRVFQCRWNAHGGFCVGRARCWAHKGDVVTEIAKGFGACGRIFAGGGGWKELARYGEGVAQCQFRRRCIQVLLVSRTKTQKDPRELMVPFVSMVVAAGFQ